MGKRLDSAMKEEGVTHAVLAKQAKVSRALVSSWVTGVSAMQAPHMLRVCKFLRITPNELLGWE